MAVGLIVFGPETRAVDGSGCFQHLRQARRQSGIAKFTLPAGKFVAILEVAELVLQLNQFRREEQIFFSVIGGIIGDRPIPGLLLRVRQPFSCDQRLSRCRTGLVRGRFARSTRFSLPCLVIQRVMKVDPKPAVQLKNG